MSAPAGWYDDPRGGGGKSWWDGSSWDFGQTSPRADLGYVLRIGLGVLAGVALAKAINGAASAPDGWALAQWANANGVQL